MDFRSSFRSLAGYLFSGERSLVKAAMQFTSIFSEASSQRNALGTVIGGGGPALEIVETGTVAAMGTIVEMEGNRRRCLIMEVGSRQVQ